MTTQERLEAFTPYFNEGIQCQIIGDLNENLFTVTGFEKHVSGNNWIYAKDNYCYLIEDVIFVLRPLSDLTKPCLDGGKVPIVELGKIAELLKPISFSEMTTFKGELNGVCAIDRYDHQWLMFDFKEGFSMWHKPHGYSDYVLTLLDHQLQLFQQLYKWHFWLGDQSEFGESIIDINTINNENR